MNNIDSISRYYSEKILTHGETAAGVDWNGEDSQQLRFQVLSKVMPDIVDGTISVSDLGCGYAAYFDYLKKRNFDFSYFGYDISLEMCNAAVARLSDSTDATIVCADSISEVSDYSIASGLFSVKLDAAEDAWFEYILKTLENLSEQSSKGFSFNCLTKYSDLDKMKDYLYYADPLVLFDLCKKRFSKNVALLHDYGLYEFTILVKK